MTAARRRVEPPTRMKTGTRRVADAAVQDGGRRVCQIVVRLSVSYPVDERSPRKTRRICGASFFWRARNSTRIARTLEKSVSCESALKCVALTANAMGRGRLFPRSGQVRAEPKCLYGVNAIQIRSLRNRIRGPEGASLLAPSKAFSRPSRGDCADEPGRGSHTPSRPALATRQGCSARATDAPVRSGATSGAKRHGVSGEGPRQVRRPLRPTLAHARRGGPRGCRQVAAKRRDWGNASAFYTIRYLLCRSRRPWFLRFVKRISITPKATCGRPRVCNWPPTPPMPRAPNGTRERPCKSSD